ncbi:MAG TPA: hypothetical protein VFE19_12360, partial [Jatrophihabitantaceae bacterium]|nr:hypothetical protein [Jatrophihabitantaceae bacterium]
MHLSTPLAIAGLVLLAGCNASTPSKAPPSSTNAGPSTSPPSSVTSSSAAQPWVVQKIRTGGQPCATLGAAGSVWVADISGGVVKRLDPATGQTIARVKTDAGPCGMAYGARSIWVENYTASTVTRINVATNASRSIKVGT